MPGPRIAMLSVHTSPLDQPGTGDAGGMNVYLSSLARALAQAGATVDIFTRATRQDAPVVVPLADGVAVRHVQAGRGRDVSKEGLADLVPEFTANLLGGHGWARRQPYDVVHSHYWLSGLVAVPVAREWSVPLVHTAHTLAKVKNAALAPGDQPEPYRRIRGEEAVVGAAHAMVANTLDERQDLVHRYGADPNAVHVVAPGVDRSVFHPGVPTRGEVRPGPEDLMRSQAHARRRLRLDPDVPIVLFAGRVQPLKAPDVLVRALALLVQGTEGAAGAMGDGPATAGAARLHRAPRLVVLGGPSGDARHVAELAELARSLGVADLLEVRRPVDPAVLARWYRAADVVAVPSRSESFGLVAAEAQACGTPVVAADVGGLRSVVRDGVSGVLVPGHDPAVWAQSLAGLLADPAARARLGAGGVRHVGRRGWDVAAEAMLAVYRRARERAARAAA